MITPQPSSQQIKVFDGLEGDQPDDYFKDNFLSWVRNEDPEAPFDGIEELQELDVPSIVVPPNKGAILDRLFPPDNLLGIKIKRVFDGDVLTGYRLCASGRVGVMAIGDMEEGGPSPFLIVKPKIPGTNLFTLLNYAFVPDLSPNLQAQLEPESATISSILILLYMYRLEQLIQETGLQRAYLKKEEELQGVIRGQIHLAAYLGSQVLKGKPFQVPCRYWELSSDCDPNRSLRWGVEVCRLLANWLPHPLLTGLIEEVWERIAPHFWNLPITPIQAEQVRRLPVTGRFQPYEPIYRILSCLLEGVSFSLQTGDIRVQGFAVEMWKVFELFVFNLLSARMRGKVKGPQAEFPYQVKGIKEETPWRHIYLDALIEGPRKLVVDTKWKEAFENFYQPDFENEDEFIRIGELKVHHGDLFQVIAYGRHHLIQADGGVIIYPLFGEDIEFKEHSIMDFSIGQGNDENVFPISLVGIPVSGNLQDKLSDFVCIIKRLAEL